MRWLVFLAVFFGASGPVAADIYYPQEAQPGPTWDLTDNPTWSDEVTWPIRCYFSPGTVNARSWSAAEYDSVAARFYFQANLSRLTTPSGRAVVDSLRARNSDLLIIGYWNNYHADLDPEDRTSAETGTGNLNISLRNSLWKPYRAHIGTGNTVAVMFIDGADTQAIGNPTLMLPAWQGPAVVEGWATNHELAVAMVDTMKRYMGYWTQDLDGIYMDHFNSTFQSTWTDDIDFDQDGTLELNSGTWDNTDALWQYGKFQQAVSGMLQKGLGPNFIQIVNGNMLTHQFDDSPSDTAVALVAGKVNGANYERFGQAIYTTSGLLLKEFTDALDRVTDGGMAPARGDGWTQVSGRTDVTLSTSGGRTTGISVTSLNYARITSLLLGVPYVWRDVGNDINAVTGEPGLFVAGSQQGDLLSSEDGTYRRYVREYSLGWARAKYRLSDGALDSVAFDLK